jgi:hypothetical protein
MRSARWTPGLALLEPPLPDERGSVLVGDDGGAGAAATVTEHAAALGQGFHRGFLVAAFVAVAAAVVGIIATPKTRPASADDLVLSEAEAAESAGGL